MKPTKVTAIKEEQSKIKFTILQREAPWTEAEGHLLVVKLMEPTYESPDHPGVIIIIGEYSRDQIVAILGKDIGKHSIVQGYKNPDLPFQPSFMN